MPSAARPSPPSNEPELAVVVLACGDEPGVVAAVASLVRQQPRPEICVVASAGGGARRRVQRAGLEGVTVIETAARLFVGAARNAGLAATTAPWVAFLAADCAAEPGWVAHRLAAHHAGAPLVSSALTNAYTRRSTAWAAYLFHDFRRMPTTPPDEAIHYGVSYRRDLFATFGLFREDLRSGEDTEFHRRLRDGGLTMCWVPQVRTMHRYPLTVGALLVDSVRRGRRTMHARRQFRGGTTRAELRDTVRCLRQCVTNAWRRADPSQRPDRRRLITLALMITVARTIGVASARLGRRRDGHRRPTEARLIALLTMHNEARLLPDYLANVAVHVDGIIALDDGSTDDSAAIVAAHPMVLEVIRLPTREPHVWDEPFNHRALIEAGHRHGAEWLVAVDADERVEDTFRQRFLQEVARTRRRRGVPAVSVAFREIWDRPDQYRTDGVWGTKRRLSLWKARPDHVYDPRPLHGHWAPLNSIAPDGSAPAGDLTIYHLHMLDRTAREARQARYEALDPDARWQPQGYAYLTDERGLELATIPADRAYWPMPSAG